MKKLLSLLFMLGAVRLCAVAPVPYTLGVSFSSRITGTGSSTMTVYAETTVAVSDSVSGGVHESTVSTAWLRPGKQYSVNFYGNGPSDFDLSFVAPDGYAVWIDGAPADLIGLGGLSGSYSYNYTVELRPAANLGRADAGSFSGIEIGQSISWSFGLGGVRNGNATGAGQVFFRELDLSTNAPANRSRLYYTAPTNYGQITKVYSGADLKQIKVPQTLVDITDLTSNPNDGYTVGFYDPSQGTWNGSSYTISGSPWRTIKVESPGTSQLKITETEGTAVRISKLVLTSGSISSGTYVLTLQEGDATNCARTTVHSSTVPTSGQRDDVVTVYTTTGTYASPTNTSVAVTKYHYENQPWGEEVKQIIKDPSGAALTTTFDYWTTNTDYGNYRKTKSIVEPTGNWVGYHYYDAWDYRGQLFSEYRPFLDSPSTVTFNSTLCRMTSYDYTLDWTGRRRIPFNRPEYNSSVATGLTYNTPTLNQVVLGQYGTINQVDNYSGASAYQRTISYILDSRYQNNPDYFGLVWSVKHPDGSQDSYAHYQGSFDTSTKVFTYGGGNGYTYWFCSAVLHGTTDSSGATQHIGYVVPITSIYLVPYKSTVDITVRNPAGLVVRTETLIYTGGSSFSLMTATDCTYDVAGRLLSTTRDNNTLSTNTYSNGRLTSTVDASGVETQYTFDALGRVATTVKKGVAASGSYAAQGDITTTFTYDGANRVTQTLVSGGSLSQSSSSTYDLAGRLTQSVAPGSYTTGYAYSSDSKTVTATLPSGATKITEIYTDGQLKSARGTSAVAQYFSYSVNGTTGLVTRQTTFGTSSSTALVKDTSDWLGRTVTQVTPGWSGTDVTKSWTYSSGGQLTKVSQPGLADTLYAYDTLGALFRSGLDINANGTLDLASDDRITEKNWSYFLYGTVWARSDSTSVYPQSGNGTPKKIDDVWNILVNPTGRLSGVIRYDVYNNATVSVVDVTPSTKTLVATTYLPTFAAYTVSVVPAAS